MLIVNYRNDAIINAAKDKIKDYYYISRKSIWFLF